MSFNKMHKEEKGMLRGTEQSLENSKQIIIVGGRLRKTGYKQDNSHQRK